VTVHRAAKRNPFACRDNPFLDANTHLSLGEIIAREAMARYRRKLVESGVELSEADAARWKALSRVPRRPPIYRDTSPPTSAA
jgi:hypothetical protein